MTLFESFLVAVSTYTVVPVPQFTWNERNMKYAICFFPAAGVLCGAALLAWYTFCLRAGVSAVFFSAAAVCLPLLLTGGIHMDGYMDTVDALASHQPRERKLEILKDPHCGAFAVIYCGIYLLMQFGVLYELYRLQAVAAVCAGYVLSRTLSALCAIHLKNARGTGMLCAYTKDTDRTKATLALVLVLLAAGGALLWLFPVPGMGMLLCAAGTVLWYQQMTMRQFGGVTGDTAGFFLQMCELACLFGAWIGVRFF